MPADGRYNFRLTVEGGDLVNVEMVDVKGHWQQVPGFFFVADMLRAASDAVLERINSDIRSDMEAPDAR